MAITMRMLAQIFFSATEVTQGPLSSLHYTHIKRTQKPRCAICNGCEDTAEMSPRSRGTCLGDLAGDHTSHITHTNSTITAAYAHIVHSYSFEVHNRKQNHNRKPNSSSNSKRRAIVIVGVRDEGSAARSEIEITPRQVQVTGKRARARASRIKHSGGLGWLYTCSAHMPA
jgi:hypothetical protein